MGLRERVGVAAGVLTIVAPLSLPIVAQGHPLSIALAAALSLFSAANLAVLAFDRALRSIRRRAHRRRNDLGS